VTTWWSRTTATSSSTAGAASRCGRPAHSRSAHLPICRYDKGSVMVGSAGAIHCLRGDGFRAVRLARASSRTAARRTISSASAIADSAASGTTGMRNWSRNGGSLAEKRCQIPLVLAGSPLPCPRRDQTAANPLAGRQPPVTATPAAPDPRLITSGNEKQDPPAAPQAPADLNPERKASTGASPENP
jgi:hypothetical protein